MNEKISKEILADIIGTSKKVVNGWVKSGRIQTLKDNKTGTEFVKKECLLNFKELDFLFDNLWDDFSTIIPKKEYNIIELFAGCGGLALGLENAGFKSLLTNEIDKDASETLKLNRPNWNVVNDDISNVNFEKYFDKVDMISGGFPCQAFSYAGNKFGFDDTRGTLFYEFARAVKEVNPKIFVAENVRGLLTHDKGRTLETIKSVISELGYDLVSEDVLKAIFYKVPQKRERLILVAIRKDLSPYVRYTKPPKNNKIFTLSDALKSGILYNQDCPNSDGQVYPNRKKEIMSLIPEGGYWKDLPDELQREYMKGSYHLGGGKTGVARRLSWSQPSLTLTCAPAQKQTERCHPEETRPLSVREYARIQTFPDNWEFAGSKTSQYKQIGNAVPVNFAYAIGLSLIKLLNDIESSDMKTVLPNVKSIGQLSFKL
jgi:DNA (cytosine-5)-methyltransferase 1